MPNKALMFTWNNAFYRCLQDIPGAYSVIAQQHCCTLARCCIKPKADLLMRQAAANNMLYHAIGSILVRLPPGSMARFKLHTIYNSMFLQSYLVVEPLADGIAGEALCRQLPHLRILRVTLLWHTSHHLALQLHQALSTAGASHGDTTPSSVAVHSEE